MILIISEDNDNSTNHVIDWLIYYGQKFQRINEEIRCDVNEILINNEKQQPSQYSVIWHRKGRILVNPGKVLLRDEGMNNTLRSQLIDEETVLSHYIYNRHRINSKNIGNYFKAININKLNILHDAKDAGLNIPDTLITTKKEDVRQFKSIHDNIITKPISDVRCFEYGDIGHVYTYTSIVDDLTCLPNTFFPSLFQKCIDKKYELRVFYINSMFYSMAIFSQNDSQTKIDFRNYNFTTPNRTVPYNLPRAIKKKIKTLMKSLGMETGSIDLLVDMKDNFYFLEINPVGQYGMVSDPCNYNLHKIITKELIKCKQNSILRAKISQFFINMQLYNIIGNRKDDCLR